MNFQNTFSELKLEIQKVENSGNVASYIPELRNVNADKFGVYLTTVDNQEYCMGDYEEKFSIQSISKVLSLTLAYSLEEENLWGRVGVEPSGSAFNSLVQLEYEKGIPRNPLINAGALVICDVLVSRWNNPKQKLIEFVRIITGEQNINYNEKIAESERFTSFRNVAHVNLMKAYGNIKNDVNAVLDLYFHMCSIEMTCYELSRCFLFLALNGVNPFTNESVISVSKSKRINAIMLLCGFYDEAGEFAFEVGLPGKSGVGGGIVAVYPGKFSIAVWSPKLNQKGNSYKGMKFLEMFTTKTQLSIF